MQVGNPYGDAPVTSTLLQTRTSDPTLPIANSPALNSGAVSLTSLRTERQQLLSFLRHGRRSRLALSLESGLPNEVDWALDALIRLSALVDDQLDIFEKVPTLFDSLFRTVAGFMALEITEENGFIAADSGSEWPSVGDATSFAQAPSDVQSATVAAVTSCSSSDNPTPPLSIVTHPFCAGKVPSYEAHRVAQIAQMLGNFGNHERSGPTTVAEQQVRRFIERCIMLDGRTEHLESRQKALVYLQNVGHLLVLTVRRTDFHSRFFTNPLRHALADIRPLLPPPCESRVLQ